jgi:alpha-galactosidase
LEAHVKPLFPLFAILALAAPVLAQGEPDLTGAEPPPHGYWVDRMDLSRVEQDWSQARAGRSVDGRPLTLGGVVYKHGVGTHASSDMLIDLNGSATRFMAVVGVDDERKGLGSVRFFVDVDKRNAASTPVMRGGDAPRTLSVDVSGAKTLHLRVDDGGDGITNDHADWGGAVLILKPGAAEQPRMAVPPAEPLPVVGAPPGPKPAIHYPRIVGATPGRSFLFRVPATGKGPLTFAASNLPKGLLLDERTGILTGSLEAPGRTDVELTVTGPKGSATATLTIVGGTHQLALTPPMGWNSWNVWGGRVDADKVRAAADAMVSSGLASHGFQYINIDDTWEGARGPDGVIRTNDKFKDMKGLADYVHSKGLKLGIYSSPGPKTCAGYAGSERHEEQDAKTYGQWGIDYLKYDWCSCRSKDLKAPYALMRNALDQSSRDIVYSLCQYGMGDVWTWGDSVGGNCWRTTGDITDTWKSMSGIGFSQDGHEKFAGPGHWNDPDMLVVGDVGWGRPHPTKLTPNEQVTHISLWALQSAPLLIGCDMSKIDPFTTALLGNDEVLAIDQDALGKPAGRKSIDGKLEVWARPLSDGTMAVGLFNRDVDPAQVTARWSDLGLTGPQPVRDLWQKKDLGTFNDAFKATVPRHGAVLVKIGTPK